MSTAPLTTAPTTFWTKLKGILPAIELAGNVALLASGLGAPFEPLVASLETATNPLLQSIGSGNSTLQEMPIFYSTAIGVLTAMKQTPGLPAATLSAIDAYLTAAENGTAAYTRAQTGYNPGLYAPVAPIA
jgi:hypothetical protein